MGVVIYLLFLTLGIHGLFYLGIRRERESQERLYRSALLSLVHVRNKRRL
jgi:hypothetical protein